MTAPTDRYYRTAFLLAVFTIVYNILEGLVSLFFGISDESLALAGFGADSLIEVISGLGILQMVVRLKKHGDETRNRAEKRSLRITGTSFYILTAALVISSGYNLFTGHKPETTFWGVVISAVSIAVMTGLFLLKLETGRKLNSAAIIADAHCTRVCIYMSVVLLVASGFYELTGLAWADIAGTLGLAWFSFTEGRECFEKVRTGGHCSCHEG